MTLGHFVEWKFGRTNKANNSFEISSFYSCIVFNFNEYKILFAF